MICRLADDSNFTEVFGLFRMARTRVEYTNRHAINNLILHNSIIVYLSK